ncbi:MAG: hypothetical protein KA129_04330 [Microthrixaceae bacterium]|nr:hypothetical protein [Microthrixaceae bacterium]
MSDDVTKAREHLDHEFADVRKGFEPIRTALARLEHAGPRDDISALLEALEDAVHKARTGGVMGSGANGHKRALAALVEAEGSTR